MRSNRVHSGSHKFPMWIMLNEQTEDEVKALIEYDYEPEEPMVMYYPDGSGYPGSPAMVEVTSVTLHSGRKVEWDSIPEATREHIEEKCWEDVGMRADRANDPY